MTVFETGNLTAASYLVAFLGLASAGVLLLIGSGWVERTFRVAVTLSALAVLAAAAATFEGRLALAASGKVPVLYHYIGWSVALPLQVLALWFLAGRAGAQSVGLFWRLAIVSVLMVFSRYLGEAGTMHATLAFLIGLVFWLYILGELYFGRMDEAVLEGFGVFFPPPLDGFTRGERFGKYVSDSQSTITASYTNGSDHYSITICFSNQRVKEDRELKTDAKKREMFGFDLMTIAGYQALAQKEGSPNTGATFLVDVSNSRNVSLLHKPGGGLGRANLLPMFEKIDFKGIAAK